MLRGGDGDGGWVGEDGPIKRTRSEIMKEHRPMQHTSLRADKRGRAGV